MASLNRSISDLVASHVALFDVLVAGIQPKLVRTSDRLESATAGPNPDHAAVTASLGEYLPAAVSWFRP